MASVVSAAVLEGQLIIGLDDGSIIRAGYVQGPQGLTGPQGPIGATGSAGEDGNTILSSQGYPRADQGKDGDFHINTRDWEIRGPKAGGTWPKAKSMLPGIEHFGKDAKTIINMGGSGGGGGSAGGAIERPPIIDDGTNTPPTIYPPLPGQPGSNLQDGDMWIDANGALHFRYNGQWNKVAVYADNVLPKDDAPYLIVTPNGEAFVHQAEYNEWLYTRTDRSPIIQSNPPTIHPDFPAYPLREGDYWIDDNNRLYYWNGTGWAPIEGGGGRNPIFDDNEPTEHPDYAPPDNILEVGDIWYDTDDNFKQYIWDGNNWLAISPDRFEAFTRVYEAVDPAGYNSGNNGTCALTATGGTIDTITNVKVAGTDQQSKVRYAYAAGQSIVIEDDRNGAYAVLSVTAVNALGDYDVVLLASNGTGTLTLGQNYSFGELTDSKVQISDDPPTPALEGDLWWNSSADEMTLYVYYTSPDGTSRWTPAAPPVSLDGINTTIATALEVQTAILERLDTGETLQATLAGKVDSLENSADNYVLKTGGIWQIMEPSLGLLGGDEATGSNLYIANKGFVRWGYGDFETQGEYGGYIFMRDDTTFEIGTYSNVDLKFNATNPEFVNSPSVPTPTEELHAANKYYVDNQIGSLPSIEDLDTTNFLEKDAVNRVTTDFRISSDNKTFISTNNNQLGLYNLVDPTNDAHAVNRGYADGRYLKKTGGTLTGNLAFNGGSRIDANTGNEVLTGRACFEIRSAADLPIAMSSGSTFKPLLAFYGYDGSQPDNKGKVAEIKANGNAYFTNVFAENEKLATQAYVDERIPEPLPPLHLHSKNNIDPKNASNPTQGQIVGYYENNPGDGSKAPNLYIGNWNHSVRVWIGDLQTIGTLPSDGTGEAHRGIFEMYTSNGESFCTKPLSTQLAARAMCLLFTSRVVATSSAKAIPMRKPARATCFIPSDLSS